MGVWHSYHGFFPAYWTLLGAGIGAASYGDVGALLAGIAAVGTLLAGFRHQSKKLEEIHVLVNDRLDRALRRIDDLEAALVQTKAMDSGSTARTLRSETKQVEHE